MKCQDCQLACYDLLDRSLCAKDEQDVLAHIERCPRCKAFLEAEGERMRTWPRLLRVATRNVALPHDAAERVAHALEISRGKGLLNEGEAGWKRRDYRRGRRWLALAASALVLASLGVTALLIRDVLPRERQGVAKGSVTDRAISSVRLLDQRNVKGLDVPGTLPGTLRLEAGEVVVRLQTGVELTMLGPAKATVRDGMRVYLERGRLFARVPHWAAGFTVRTRQLEVRDVGTVFSVSADETVSDVFVFKGCVQVSETGEGAADTSASGMAIGLCQAGEGVWAKAGEMPLRFVADSAEAQALYGEVKGCAALKDPNRARQAVQKIALIWTERHMPGSGLSERIASDAGEAPAGEAQAAIFSPQADPPKSTGCAYLKAGMMSVTNSQATDLYFAAGCSGPAAWDTVGGWRVFQSAGGGVSGRLPASNDTVRINAATLAAENGNALVITNGVHAVCDSFASGYKDYPGTACLKLDGGTLTSRTSTVIGMYYPGLATLARGTLYSGTDLYIGGYGDCHSGRGIVTNTGATIIALKVHVGHEANTFGRLAHGGGTLDCQATDTRSSLQIGYNGGVGEFEAGADFSAYDMGIGLRGSALFPLGTGTVTVTEKAVGEIRSQLRVSNGALIMKGGQFRFQNTSETLANLYVCQDADGQALIRGWGRFVCNDPAKPLRLINNGWIIADGEGVNRELDFERFSVVDNDPHGRPRNGNGWYAVNKGRVLFPRVDQSFLPGTAVCWGDVPSKAVPERINSVALTFTAPVTCSIRGGFCASDRNDLPRGLPEHLRPVGLWCIGACSERDRLIPVSFAGVSLTFRYDHTKLVATDRKLRLYRYDGNAWIQVGTGLPGGGNRIATDTALAAVASGEYNIGWFALLAAETNGTVLSIF